MPKENTRELEIAVVETTLIAPHDPHNHNEPWGPHKAFFHTIRCNGAEKVTGITELRSWGCSVQRGHLYKQAYTEALQAILDSMVLGPNMFYKVKLLERGPNGDYS